MAALIVQHRMPQGALTVEITQAADGVAARTAAVERVAGIGGTAVTDIADGGGIAVGTGQTVLAVADGTLVVVQSSNRHVIPPDAACRVEHGARLYISDLDDAAFCRWLTVEKGVVAIPLSPFYGTPPAGQRLARLCFAKNEATLDAAIERLRLL